MAKRKYLGKIMNGKLCNLRLVAPAFSNHEIEQIKDNKEYTDYLKKSNLYMIVQRREIIFSDYAKNEKDNCLYFTMSLKNSDIKSSGYINIDEFFNKNLKHPIKVEAGEKGVSVIDAKGEIYQVLTEYIWYYKSRKKNGLYGFENYRDFTNFHLHYIGISKRRDSFTRLVEKAHAKRLEILLKEDCFDASSKIKDETYLLFFNIVDMDFAIIDDIKEIENVSKEIDMKKKIADAEKAFLKFSKCKYNEELYNNYPISKDGLYGENIDSYTYQIQEDITLVSNKGSFVGRYGYENSNFADLIFVDGKNAAMRKAADY